MKQERIKGEGVDPPIDLIPKLILLGLFLDLLVSQIPGSLEIANSETQILLTWSAPILILHETIYSTRVVTLSVEKPVTMFKNIMGGNALKTTFLSFNFPCLKGLINCVNS